MKNLLSFSLIGIVLLFNENVNAAQQKDFDGTMQTLNSKFNTKQKQVTMQYKITKPPHAPALISKEKKQKKSKQTKQSKMPQKIEEIVYTEKHFSPNIEQLKFDKFCMNDDTYTLANQNAQETFTRQNLPILCTKNDLSTTEIECFIPYGFTNIDQQIMMDNANLTKAYITETVYALGDFSFLNCTNLSHFEVIGTPHILYIGKCTFKNTNFTKVIIPYGVRYIGDNAYANCRSLEEIHVPSSVRDIGINIVNDCPKLRDIFLPHNAVVRLSKQNRFYSIEVRFSGITEGVYNLIGSYEYLNIHKKNEDGSYTNVSIYKDTVASCTSDLCRNALLEFDTTKQDNTLTF